MKNAAGEEVFVYRFEDGPASGDRFVTETQVAWPPPDRLCVGWAVYQKVGQSQLSYEQAADAEHLVRGVVFRLAPDGEAGGV